MLCRSPEYACYCNIGNILDSAKFHIIDIGIKMIGIMVRSEELKYKSIFCSFV